LAVISCLETVLPFSVAALSPVCPHAPGPIKTKATPKIPHANFLLRLPRASRFIFIRFLPFSLALVLPAAWWIDLERTSPAWMVVALAAPALAVQELAAPFLAALA
jgi:hypothetical protein